MDRLAKYFNIILGLGFITLCAVGVIEVVRASPSPGEVFKVIGFFSILVMFFGLGVMNLITAIKEHKNYIYKGRNYYVVSDGLMKDPDTREWKSVKIYKAEGIKTQFVRDAKEFEVRFKQK